MKAALQNILKGEVVIVGVGNVLKGDDAFGPELIKRIQNKIPAVCIDAGTAPENHTKRIVQQKPDTILLVDVAHLDSAPGTVALLEKEDIIKSGFTTHDISPRMFMDYLASQTQAHIVLLGIQPKNLSLGDDMSESVKKKLDEIETLMRGVLHA